jgi:hypothetical protein
MLSSESRSAGDIKPAKKAFRSSRIALSSFLNAPTRTNTSASSAPLLSNESMRCLTPFIRTAADSNAPVQMGTMAGTGWKRPKSASNIRDSAEDKAEDGGCAYAAKENPIRHNASKGSPSLGRAHARMVSDRNPSRIQGANYREGARSEENSHNTALSHSPPSARHPGSEGKPKGTEAGLPNWV